MITDTSTYSLRRRLITWISLPVLTASIVTLLISFAFIWYEIEEVYDAQLVHSAKVLLQLTEHEILEDEGFHLGLEDADLEHRYERNLGFRLWVDDEIITQSPNTTSFTGFEARPGFSDHTINHEGWRFFVYVEPTHNIKIEVSEKYEIRYELIIQMMSSLIVPGLIFIPALFLIIWIGVRKILKPVTKISAEMDKRSADDFSPIEDKRVAEEIAPLVQAVNRLFSRIEQTFQKEREFTDHAAHELRTPLAAMKTQAQVIAKKLEAQGDSTQSVENLLSSIDRATRLVDQLLSLARLQNIELSMANTDVSQCVYDALSDIQNTASQKNITLKIDLADDVKKLCHEDSVMILLRNLLDNAVKYTPKRGVVSVTMTDQFLIISDTGPGLSDENKKKVFDRFYRADKTGESGSGLGLAIVQWIANAHNYTVELRDNENGGLDVSVGW